MKARMGLALATAGVLLLLVSPSSTLAACGGSGDGWFARYVGRHAETIVLARVTGPIYVRGSPHDPSGIEMVRVEVLRVLRGEADDLVEVTSSVLPDCTHTSAVGDRIVLAFVDSSPDGAFVGSFHEDGRGRWWHHFDSYASLAALQRAMDTLPDTAGEADRTESLGRGDAIHIGVWWAAALALGLALQLRLSSCRRVVRPPAEHRVRNA